MPMMSELEAKGKGCPWARVFSGSAAVNRTPGGIYHPGAKCVTSNCMAWAWLNEDKKLGDCRLCVPAEAM
jgi:hypothetical protein